MALYEAAIDAATTSERGRERALANERYAHFWLQRQQPKVAAVFMTEARSAYASWGAAAKVEQLERKYPGLLEPPADAGQRQHTAAVTPPLDISTVMKAAQAITAKLVLEDFLRELVRIAIENAGAQRGVFLNRSARQDRPLVKVNCGAIAAGLVESELFGHMKGAFTGALERRVGRFELADGGTIFLDEIGELPLDTQVKLLRVLQEQEFEPVGSSRTVRVDVRIIAATNRDLEEAVRTGRFRSDLFYRLNVFPLQVPPLRERRADIPQLVMFFFSRFAKKLGKRIEAVPQGVMNLLTTYAWPGNIRELQNLIERAVVLSQGPVLRLDPALLPVVSQDAAAMTPEPPAEAPRRVVRGIDRQPASASPVLGEARTLDEVEKNHILILAVLRQTRGLVEGPKGAARILNLHPNTLRSRMKRLGIKPSDHDIS
jgi:DNA-binding NtrC family response regulator